MVTATIFLHNDVILEILNFVLFLGGAWGVCKVTLVEDTKVKFSNHSVNVVSHSKWRPI